MRMLESDHSAGSAAALDHMACAAAMCHTATSDTEVSFRGEAFARTRNLEIFGFGPRRFIALDHPGMTVT